MKTAEELVARACELADEIRADLKFAPADREGYGGYWIAATPDKQTSILANAATALEFLSMYAGRNSEWYERAKIAYDSSGGGKSMETGVEAMAEILRRWAANVQSGVASIVGAEAASARAVASTDLMDQVRLLNADKNVHVAAPIVLAGAALETALRGAIEELGLELPVKPSIATYADVLREGGYLSKQEVKDVTSMGGTRNSAAHGQFEELSRERAGLMEQQVNFLLAQLATKLGD